MRAQTSTVEKRRHGGNATRKGSVRRYTRLTPHLVVSRDDSGDPSLRCRPPSSGGDSNGGPRGRLGSDSFMRMGIRLCSKGLWLKLKMYSDNKFVKEEDKILTSGPFRLLVSVTKVTGISHRSICHAPFQKTLSSTEESRAESPSSAFGFDFRLFFGWSSEGAAFCSRLS